MLAAAYLIASCSEEEFPLSSSCGRDVHKGGMTGGQILRRKMDRKYRERRAGNREEKTEIKA